MSLFTGPSSILEKSIWEDTGLAILARIENIDGEAITQASLSTITCKVYDLSTLELVTSPTVTIATSVFDTMQTPSIDDRWDVDAIGYNFKYNLPALAFPTGDREYRVEFNFDPASGDDFPLMCAVFAKNRMAS